MYAKLSTMSQTSQAALHYVQRLQEQGMNIETNLSNITNTSSVITYVCHPCGTRYSKSLSAIFEKGERTCRNCAILTLTVMPTNDEILHKVLNNGVISSIQGEEWRSIIGAWISSHGRCINVHGKVLTQDEKGRYFTNKKLQYAKILMAQAFKDKILITEEAQKNPENAQVTLIDNTKPLHVSNLKMCSHAESCKPGKPRQSDKFKHTRTLKISDYIEKQIKNVKLAELPDHLLFEDGNMYNTSRSNIGFLTFSQLSDRRLVTTINNKPYQIGKLFCVAFHPLEGKSCYDDYKDLECNHIDGDPTNNRADNLEWTTHSQNMQHAYDTKLNKKVRAVIQYAIGEKGIVGQEIKHFDSIAQASKMTGEPEHRIRETANGKKKKPTNFWWKFVDESITEEWSNKYASKRKTPDV